jgi:hypothetical protein
MFAVSHLKDSIEDGLVRQMWLVTEVLPHNNSSHITCRLRALRTNNKSQTTGQLLRV